jgi:hypothetical protein
LLAWQNYWVLIGWEEYNYFINCTAVQLMIFPKQTKWRKGILNTNVKWNCPRGTIWKYKQKHQILLNKRTKWKYEQKHLILVESMAGLGFGERIWLSVDIECWRWVLTLRSIRIQFFRANNKQVIMRCCHIYLIYTR